MPTGSGNQKGVGAGDQYSRQPQKFEFRGLDVNHPENLLDRGYLPLVRNLRSYMQGVLTTRPGLTSLSSGHLSGHSIFRLNDPSLADYNYFCGVGTQVKFGKAALAVADSGYSGDPLTAIIARPTRSPSPQIYIANQLRLKKFGVSGTPQNWGIDLLNTPPEAKPDRAQMLLLTDCTSAGDPTVNPESGLVWNLTGTGSAPTSGTRVSTTISVIHYDLGPVGYCNIVPAAITGTEFQPGMRLRIDSGGASDETIQIEQVFPAIKTTTIQDIFYDSGTFGPATIILTTSSPGLVVNNLILIGGTEYARIEAVINGPANQPALRVTLAGTFAAGATVSGARNIRGYATLAHVAAQTLTARYYQFSMAAAGTGALKHNVARDLSSFPTGPNGVQSITNDDYISIGIYIDDISRLLEGRVWICVDPQVTGAYAATDYTRDYYYYPFRPNDLQAQSLLGTVTQIQTSSDVIQKSFIDQFNTSNTPMATTEKKYRDIRTGQLYTKAEYDQFIRTLGGKALVLYQPVDVPTENTTGINPNPSMQSGNWQVGTGFERWYQLRFRIGDLIRVGTDKTRTLKDVTSIMVSFNVSGATVQRFSSICISGGDGPDIGDDTDLTGRAYYYRVVGRNEDTGETGPPSPSSRGGVITRRQRISATCLQHPDPQVTKLDWYRYGGTLFEWRFAGTTENSVSPRFVDTSSDAAIANNPLLEFSNFPPFATADRPRSGTADVTGTMIRRLTGDVFNVNWAPGTQILVQGVAFQLYRHPLSTSALEVTAAANFPGITPGTYTWEIPNPILISNPLKAVWGPFGQGSSGLYYFAVGDMNNPGVIYWTNPNDPNSMSDANFLEITSPSEPLIMGVIYDGRCYVFSSEQMFYLNPNFNPQPGESIFLAQPVANSRGAWSYTGVTVDDKIYFWGKDGIYESEGGQPRSLTDDRLYPLFPHDGQLGSDIGEIKAPDYSRPLSMRLQADGEFLRAIYQSVDASWCMLIMDKSTGAWFYDTYGDGGLQVIQHDRGEQQYRLMGFTALGNFVQQSGVLDVGTAIQARWRTQAFDGGETRAEKRWGDYSVDLAGGAQPIAIVPYFENFTLPEPLQVVNAPLRQLTILDLNSGDEKFGVNFGLDFTHSGAGGSVVFAYEWQPSWILKPERAFLRATDWEGFGDGGNVFLQGLLIEADTLGADKTVQVDTDLGIVATLTLNHARQSTKPYVIDPPVTVHQVRLISADSNDSWRLYGLQWIWQPMPESVGVWNSPPVAHGMIGWSFLRELWVSISAVADVSLVVTIDGVAQPAITIPNTGGVQLTRYFSFYPVKGKLFSYRLTSPSPFQLFETQSGVMVGAWARGEGLLMATQPFGDGSAVGQQSAAGI